MESRPQSIILIEHEAALCPAKTENRHIADEVVPAIEAAAAAGKIPEAFAFATVDHGGVALVNGTPEEVRAALPAIPHHLEPTVKDATGDESVAQFMNNPARLDDPKERTTLFAHVEQQYFPNRFPNKDGVTVTGAELPGFIRSKHQ